MREEYCSCCPDIMDPKNRFQPENRFIGDIEDGKRYPFDTYTKEETDEKIEALEATIGTKASETEAIEIRHRLDVLEHTGFAIKSYTASPDLCEMGSVNTIQLDWELTGEAVSQNINGTPVTGSPKFYSNVTKDTEYTLNVSDGEATVTQTVAVSFANRVYFGVADNTGDVSRLNSELSNEPERQFKVNAGAGKYIIYASPTRLGEVRLFVGGIEGGFAEPEEQRIQNSNGYWENYLIYKSINTNLGETIVEVRRGS